MDLAGKVAVVTGASSGLGEATAKALSRAGMTVVAVARRRERLDDLAAHDPLIRSYAADVTSTDDMARLAGWVRAEVGACHLLVNNAGAKLGGDRFAGPDDVEGVAATMEVNFFGTVRCMGAFADLLAESAPSRVVNVASVAGKVGVGPPSYVASKFAVIGFTEAVGRDWAKRGITVTQLNPGFIRTEGFPQADLVANPATRRIVGEPSLVADAVVEVARSGKAERTVPRWYRAAPVVRHAAPPLWRAITSRLPR
jgi:NAD(P)-dependent dehydrogenase (short-subunit alcohol dehydrogenase family)